MFYSIIIALKAGYTPITFLINLHIPNIHIQPHKIIIPPIIPPRLPNNPILRLIFNSPSNNTHSMFINSSNSLCLREYPPSKMLFQFRSWDHITCYWPSRIDFSFHFIYSTDLTVFTNIIILIIFHRLTITRTKSLRSQRHRP